VAIVIAVAALVPEGAAFAGEKGKVRLAVEGAVARTRRKIAIGPQVGVGGSFTPGSSDLDVPITFGIGLRLFKIPVIPTASEIQSIILHTVKKRLAVRVEDMISRGEPPPSASELEAIAKEIKAELEDRYLGKRPRGRTLEKPQLAVTLEEVHLPSAGAWMTRLTIGLPVSKVTIGPSITGSLGDIKGLYLGGELALHLTPKRGPRSPVIDIFLRGDWGATGGARDHDLLALGLRVMLDLI
jgi:hypothetical protein